MQNNWSDKHTAEYATSDWIDKPSIFAETAISYFPEKGKILDLGAGQGQDSRFFAEHGYAVTSTDLEQSALDLSKSKLPHELADKVDLRQVDLRERLPFADAMFDVVYAHLSFHYFSEEVTKQLLAEVKRVLRPGGMLAFLVNTALDPEADMGIEIEPNYRQIGQTAKRFFTIEMTKEYTMGFVAKVLDNQGETYKDRAKGVHNLIRFIGTKSE